MVTELLLKVIFITGNEGRRGNLMQVKQEKNHDFQVHQKALEFSLAFMIMEITFLGGEWLFHWIKHNI